MSVLLQSNIFYSHKNHYLDSRLSHIHYNQYFLCIINTQDHIWQFLILVSWNTSSTFNFLSHLHRKDHQKPLSFYSWFSFSLTIYLPFFILSYIYFCCNLTISDSLRFSAIRLLFTPLTVTCKNPCKIASAMGFLHS